MTMKDPVFIRVGSAANTHPDRFSLGDIVFKVRSSVVLLLYLIHVTGPKAVTLQQCVEIVCDKCNTQQHRPACLRSQAVRSGGPAGSLAFGTFGRCRAAWMRSSSATDVWTLTSVAGTPSAKHHYYLYQS